MPFTTLIIIILTSILNKILEIGNMVKRLELTEN